MKYLILLGLLLSFGANASECSFHYLLRGFSPKGELLSETIVDYPGFVNDSSGPLFFPLIKGLPDSCKNKSCTLFAYVNEEKLESKSSYNFDAKKGYWLPEKMPPKMIDIIPERVDGKFIYFKVQHKDKTVCSHSIEVELRD